MVIGQQCRPAAFVEAHDAVPDMTLNSMTQATCVFVEVNRERR